MSLVSIGLKSTRKKFTTPFNQLKSFETLPKDSA